MSTGIKKIIIVLALLGAIGAVIAAKQLKNAENHNIVNTPEPSETVTKANLPRLLELGGGKCAPCKQMMPVIEELKTEYPSTLKVDYINVKEDLTAKEKYNWELIPTQIFYDAEGNELFRHIGFYSKQQILDKFNEHGIEITEPK